MFVLTETQGAAEACASAMSCISSSKTHAVCITTKDDWHLICAYFSSNVFLYFFNYALMIDNILTFK